MTEATDINAKQKRICVDCGKVFKLEKAATWPDSDAAHCPRCMSTNHIEFVESEHEDVSVSVPEGYSAHPLEAEARRLFDRVTALTEWREAKVRMWFQTNNPLLGNVSPEFMIMNGNAERLEKFIKDAEYFAAESGTC